MDRFWRPDPSRTRSTGGNGLGLAIVDALVTNDEGTIALTPTAPAPGLTVNITWPARRIGADQNQ